MLDWFFNFFDRIAQSMIWKSIFTHLNWVDGFAVLFVIAGIVYGLRNGFMGELAEILEICIVITLTHEFYVKLDYLLRRLFTRLPEDPIAAVSFILTGSAAWFVVGFVAARLKKLVHTKMTPLLHMSGGAVLGAVHLLLIFSFISQAVILMPIGLLRRGYEPENSTFGRVIARLSPRVHHVVTQGSLR